MNETDISEYEDIVIEKVGYPEDMAGSIELQEFRIECSSTERRY